MTGGIRCRARALSGQHALRLFTNHTVQRINLSSLLSQLVWKHGRGFEDCTLEFYPNSLRITTYQIVNLLSTKVHSSLKTGNFSTSVSTSDHPPPFRISLSHSHTLTHRFTCQEPALASSFVKLSALTFVYGHVFHN